MVRGENLSDFQFAIEMEFMGYGFDTYRDSIIEYSKTFIEYLHQIGYKKWAAERQPYVTNLPFSKACHIRPFDYRFF